MVAYAGCLKIIESQSGRLLWADARLGGFLRFFFSPWKRRARSERAMHIIEGRPRSESGYDEGQGK
jgi:hypothetical protein